jgi:hypothetical protein
MTEVMTSWRGVSLAPSAVSNKKFYRPRKSSNQFWTAAELRALRENAHLGCAELMRILPHRTFSAIHSKAKHEGIRITQAKKGSAEYRWRGRLPIPEKAHPLVKELTRHMNRERTLTHEVAEKSGVSQATISNWRWKNGPLLDNFIAVLNAMDLDLKIVHRSGE